MEFRTFFAQSLQGEALALASVTVYEAGTLNLAQPYDEAGGEIPNPFTATAAGEISFAAANGSYDILVQENGGTATQQINGVQFFDPAGLEAAVAAKADAGHEHSIGDVSGLQAALDAKAAASHSHTIADVSNLQATLDGKATKTGTETLSNKTLASPIINTSVTGTALASQAEAEAGAAANKLMTPERVSQAIAAQAAATTWINLDASGLSEVIWQIPYDATEIIVSWKIFSSNIEHFRMGTAGGLLTSGYDGWDGTIDTGTTASNHQTGEFGIWGSSNAGTAIFNRLTLDRWNYTANYHRTNRAGGVAAGTISASGSTITQLQAVFSGTASAGAYRIGWRK